MEIGVGQLVCIHSRCLSSKGGSSVWGLSDCHNVHFGNTYRLRPTRNQNNTIIHPIGNIVVVFLPLFFQPLMRRISFKKCSATSPGKPSRKHESCATLGSWLEAGKIGQQCRLDDCMVMNLLSLNAMQWLEWILRLRLPTQYYIWLFSAPDSITKHVVLPWTSYCRHISSASFMGTFSKSRLCTLPKFTKMLWSAALCHWRRGPQTVFSSSQLELLFYTRRTAKPVAKKTLSHMYHSLLAFPLIIYTHSPHAALIYVSLPSSSFLLTHSELCSPILTVILSNWARPWKRYQKVEVFAWLVWNHHIGTLFQSTQVCFCFKHKHKFISLLISQALALKGTKSFRSCMMNIIQNLEM